MKIQNKLYLILFGFSFLLVTIMVSLMQWSIGKGMIDYINTKEIETLKPVVTELKEEYKLNNSWKNMAGEHRKFLHLITKQLIDSDFSFEQKRPPPEFDHFRPPPKTQTIQKNNMNPSSHSPPPREHEAYYALLDKSKGLVVGKYIQDLDYSLTDIKINNVIVGYFAVSKRNQLTEGYEVDFIEQQEHYLWLIALIAMILVALVTLPLARHLVEPIKLIAQGMHKLTQGNYKQIITLKRQDELGELSRDFNELALTLVENDSARKRWLANISHELRTPVSILRGELEAMLDNVRPLNKDNITSANEEVIHLQRLIDDLNLLTSTDIGGMRYRKKNQSLTSLLCEVVDKYSRYLKDANITLNLEIKNKEIVVFIDKTRVFQLFENIINNCIKYSSASRLNIKVSVKNLEVIASVIIKFEDNGVGVDDVHLPHLFEHLYRVEDSRNRKTGGSGLGLSICRHIVIAHQGEIKAEKSSLGGLAISIKLPITSLLT